MPIPPKSSVSQIVGCLFDRLLLFDQVAEWPTICKFTGGFEELPSLHWGGARGEVFKVDEISSVLHRKVHRSQNALFYEDL